MRLLDNIRQLLPLKQGFLRNVIVLSGGTTVAQVLSILASPWLSRLYSPSDFGIFAVYSSILALFLIIVSLRYEIAIPLPEDSTHARHLAQLALLIVGAVSVVSLLAVWGGRALIETWTHVSGLAAVLFVLPLNLLIAGVFQVISYWVTRTKRFLLLSTIRAAQSIGQLIVQVGLGLAAFQAWGLIIGMLVAQSLGVVGLLGSNRDLISRSSLHDLGKVASEYRRFPLYTIWASLVDTIGAQAPLLLFTTFFELSVTGQFSLATRMLALPAAIIGQAVGDVFYPTIAKFKQDLPTSLAMIEELATQLLFVALVVFTPVTLFGPLLFRFVFGSRWEQAGVFAAYLAPWLIVSFVTSPLSPFSLVHQKLKENFLFSLIMTTLRIVVIGIGAFYHRADLAVVLFSAVGSIVYIIYGDWLLRLAGSSLLIWLRQSGPMLIIWMLMMGGLLAIQALLPLTIVIGLSIASLLLFGRYYIRHLIALTRLKSSAQALV